VLAIGACTKTESPSTASTTTKPPTTGSTTAPPPPTTGSESAAKTAYLVEVNALCKTMNESVAALASAPPGADGAAKGAAINQITKLVADTVATARNVASPPGDEAEVANVWVTADTFVVVATTYGAALTAGDNEEATSLAIEVDARQSEANDAANAYGLTECGKGS